MGLKREKLALMIGKSYSTVLSYEQETRDPNSTVWLKLAEIFDTSVDELMGVERRAGGDSDDLAKIWPEVFQVLQACSRIPPASERRRIARIIRAALTEDIDS
jgi:DNA-binding XRE family transcriptional regulator